MGNLTFWKWLRNNIKSPNIEIFLSDISFVFFYCFIFVFGALIIFVSTIIFAKAITEGTYIGILISLLMIPIGILILFYGWYKVNVEPYLGGKI